MIAAVILAASASRRRGQPKQLVPWGDTTLIRAIASQVCGSACGDVAIVLGAHADLIVPELAGLAITPIATPSWATHVSSSLHVAIDWARERGAEALVLVGCEQPRLTSKHVDRLCGAYRMAGRSVASRYAGMLGLPAVIDATDFAALLADGVPLVTAAAVPVPWPDGAFDVVTSFAAAIRRRIS